MKTKHLLAIFIVLVIGYLALAVKSKAETTQGELSSQEVFLLPNTATFQQTDGEYGQKLLLAVEQAKELLQTQVDNQLADKSYRAPVVKSREVPLEIIVALWNPISNEFDLVRVLKNGKKLTSIGQRNYKFKLIKDNGVNSVIEITNRTDLKVLGLIHPVFAEISTSQPPRYRLENVVYVPYSNLLNNDFIVKAGVDYLNKKVEAVYDELNNLKIKSLAQPNLLITEVVDESIVKTILAIEHVDSTVLINNSALDYLRKFYITLAVNEHASYAYAKSSASARGLVQFIPSTYASIRKMRPELTLPADFVQGMTDPYNAIKAEIALLDYNLTLLPKDTRAKYSSDVPELGAFLAAMYNGGPSRVRRAINRWGEDWASYHGNISTSLRSETAYYVAKFRLVYSYFTNDSLHIATAIH